MLLLLKPRLFLILIAFLAMFIGSLIVGVPSLLSDADHQRLVHHQVEENHRLNDWRLK
jgi:hypothetical protein